MKSIFELRREYQDYVNDCMEACEAPWPFRKWFETVYHYDMADALDSQVEDYTVVCLN